MQRKFVTFMCIFAFVFMPLFVGMPQSVKADGGTAGGAMPANPEKIAQLLIRTGVLSANATPQERDAAVQAYLQKKMSNGGVDKNYNPKARKQVEANEAALNNAAASSDLRGRKLGNKVEVSPSTPGFKPVLGSDKLLLIAVEFSDSPYTWDRSDGSSKTAFGPLHNQLPVPNNGFDLYVKDFSLQHYEDMLFTPGGWEMPADSPRYAGKHLGSMHDYYLAQSYGEYTVDGKAYGWFTVDKPEAYYGDDDPNGSNDDMLPGTTPNLIEDAVAKVNATNAIPWAEYDSNGDCVIDHPLFIHAGADQSGGGGAQGDDAIWAHSSSVDVKVAETADCPGGLFIENYTIMPEDGGVGVFAHEFGHDLGLPDEYDTIYSGRGDDVGFWSLMSSGSWVGQPAQTQPSDISIWGRYALGWVTDNLAVVNASDLTKSSTVLRLEQSERWGGDGTINAIRVNLPKKKMVLNTPHSTPNEWFSGQGDEIDNTLKTSVDLTGKTSASLSFWTMYDMEEQWDFGFVQVSTDGEKWTSLANADTRSDLVSSGYPDIRDNLPGFTGNSNGWVQETFDLSAYAGKQIYLQFRYMTDWGTNLTGFFVDDINVTADGATVFADSADAMTPDIWATDSWTRSIGYEMKTQYYLIEWRNSLAMETPYEGASIVNFDQGLSNVYQHDPYSATPDEPWIFSYAPGMLMWYRDMSYSNNWTGVHPGGGFLLVVDAHPTPLQRAPYLNYGTLPWNSRVQTYDSAFGLTKVPSMVLSYWGVERKYNGANAQPVFDDSKSYWSPNAPDAGVITPSYGLLFRVVGEAADKSAAFIGLGLK